MHRVQSSLVILLLALVGCAGESEPNPAPQTAPQVAIPLTPREVESYRQDFARMFATQPSQARRSARGGTTVDVTGHANVALIKFDADGAISTTCADTEQAAIDFLTAAGGQEVK